MKAQSLRQKHEIRIKASAPHWLENIVLGQFIFTMRFCTEDKKFIDYIVLILKKEEVMEYIDTISTLYAKLAQRKDYLEKETK